MIEDKYYSMNRDELLESDFWISKLYNNTIIDETVPVFIPSYNRPNELYTSRLLGDNMWPVIFVVRKSQEQDYLNSPDLKNHKVLAFDDNEISSAAAVKNKIMDYCIKNNIHRMMMADDDFKITGFKRPYTTRDGRHGVTMTGNIDIPKMWKMLYDLGNYFFDKYPKLVIVGPHAYSHWFPSGPDVVDSEKCLKLGSSIPSCLVCINVDAYKESGIHYDVASGKYIHEDLDLICQMILKGYLYGTFDWMYLEDMGNSSFDFDSIATRFKSQAEYMMNKYKDYNLILTRKKKGVYKDYDEPVPHTVINTRAVRKILNLKNDEKYLPYIEN